MPAAMGAKPRVSMPSRRSKVKQNGFSKGVQNIHYNIMMTWKSSARMCTGYPDACFDLRTARSPDYSHSLIKAERKDTSKSLYSMPLLTSAMRSLVQLQLVQLLEITYRVAVLYIDRRRFPRGLFILKPYMRGKGENTLDEA